MVAVEVAVAVAAAVVVVVVVVVVVAAAKQQLRAAVGGKWTTFSKKSRTGRTTRKQV